MTISRGHINVLLLTGLGAWAGLFHFVDFGAKHLEEPLTRPTGIIQAHRLAKMQRAADSQSSMMARLFTGCGFAPGAQRNRADAFGFVATQYLAGSVPQGRNHVVAAEYSPLYNHTGARIDLNIKFSNRAELDPLLLKHAGDSGIARAHISQIAADSLRASARMWRRQ